LRLDLTEKGNFEVRMPTMNDKNNGTRLQ